MLLSLTFQEKKAAELKKQKSFNPNDTLMTHVASCQLSHLGLTFDAKKLENNTEKSFTHLEEMTNKKFYD